MSKGQWFPWLQFRSHLIQLVFIGLRNADSLIPTPATEVNDPATLLIISVHLCAYVWLRQSAPSSSHSEFTRL